MSYQLISETERTALQFGARVVKFAKNEYEDGAKWVSEHISKDLADEAQGLEGIAVSEVSGAEAKAADAAVAAAQKEADKLKAQVESKAAEELKKAEASAAAVVKAAEEKAAQKAEAALGSKIAQEVGNLTGPAASLTQPVTTERTDPPAVIPHVENGDGGLSAGPEDGKPLGAIDPLTKQPEGAVAPANVDQAKAKADKQAKADATKGQGSDKPAETGGPKK